MQQIVVQISGTAPLLMHNSRLANPLDEYAVDIKKITSKRIKTEEDYAQIYRLEFLGGLYYNKKDGIYIPGENIDATIRDGAKLLRKGMDIKRGVMTMENKVPLTYEGPRDPEKLAGNGFADIRRVQVNKGSSAMRCRPRFDTWACAFTLSLDPEVISPADLRLCVDLAGQRIGLGDYRPRYGKFEVDKWVVG